MIFLVLSFLLASASGEGVVKIYETTPPIVLNPSYSSFIPSVWSQMPSYYQQTRTEPVIPNIYSKPVMMFIQSGDGLEVHLLKDGLSSVGVNPATAELKERLENRVGVVFYPAGEETLSEITVKDLPIRNVVIPERTGVGSLAEFLGGRPIPWLMVYEESDVPLLNTEVYCRTHYCNFMKILL